MNGRRNIVPSATNLYAPLSPFCCSHAFSGGRAGIHAAPGLGVPLGLVDYHQVTPTSLSHPLSTLSHAFHHYLHSIFVVYNSVTLPFYVGFEQLPGSGWYQFEVFIDIMFGIDIILNFRTAVLLLVGGGLTNSSPGRFSCKASSASIPAPSRGGMAGNGTIRTNMAC
jgi:hypothetical protein